MRKANRVAMLIMFGALTMSGSAGAACTANTKVNFNTLKSILPGKYACVREGSNWKWQELHVGTAGVSESGDLIDYKMGPTDKVDPSKRVGSWALGGQGNNATVTYTYDAFGSAQSYTHTVHSNSDGSYSFCGSGPEVIARLQGGTSGCN